MAEPRELGHGDAFRRRSPLEAAGDRLRGVLPQGGARNLLRRAYHALLRVTSGGGVRARLPGGEQVRLLPEYRYVTWNPAEYQAFRAAVAPGAVALDVGANAGAYALLLGQWVGPRGRVYAFEPASEVFSGLAAQLRLNRLEGVVRPVRLAVAASSGPRVLAVDVGSGESRLAEGGVGEAVESVSLDDFCAREDIIPTFIKIDVEGAELEVLRGAREVIRRAGPGLALFVEMHPRIWPAWGYGRAELEQELAAQGLRAEPLRPVHDMWQLEGECLRLVRV